MHIKKGKFDFIATLIELIILLFLILVVVIFILINSGTSEIINLNLALFVIGSILLIISKNVIIYFSKPATLFVCEEDGISVNKLGGKKNFYAYKDINRIGIFIYRDVLFLKRRVFVIGLKTGQTLDFRNVKSLVEAEKTVQEIYHQYIKKHPNDFVNNKDVD